MGQLILLDNSTNRNILRTGIDAKFVDVSGTLRTFKTNAIPNYAGDFYVTNWGTVITAADQVHPHPHASSNSSIPADTYAVPNEVGSCSIAFTKADAGWNANITITGSGLQDETVNSLLFEIVAGYGNYSSTANALFFAYILDSPITLNAENNYTANLTMSVSFE